MNRRRRRASPEVWKGKIRPAIYARDKGICQSPDGPHKQYCINRPMKYREFHTDHIVPFRLGGTDDLSNLRTLCPMCHALRADNGHHRMAAKLLAKNKLPASWPELVWE